MRYAQGERPVPEIVEETAEVRCGAAHIRDIVCRDHVVALIGGNRSYRFYQISVERPLLSRPAQR